MDHQLQPPLRNVFFSQRRRTRQRTVKQAQRGGSVPDWVWGAGLGVIVLIFVGGFFLFSSINGASAACDTALKPLPPQSDTSAAGFAAEDVKMGHLIDFLNQGDVSAASDYFYASSDVHAFMHNADPVIRAKDEPTAKNLCNAVIKLETDMDVSARQTTATMAVDATAVRKYLDDGAVALGYPRPGS
jgi:hypothetical protein